MAAMLHDANKSAKRITADEHALFGLVLRIDPTPAGKRCRARNALYWVQNISSVLPSAALLAKHTAPNPDWAVEKVTAVGPGIFATAQSQPLPPRIAPEQLLSSTRKATPACLHDAGFLNRSFGSKAAAKIGSSRVVLRLETVISPIGWPGWLQAYLIRTRRGRSMSEELIVQAGALHDVHHSRI
jgi:hypothetical protein